MKSYKELIVWQKSFKLVLEIYRITKKFPKEELYVLTSQIRKCVISISSNIAEGYSRRSRKEYIQFIRIAFGSAIELETQLLIAKELKYLHPNDFKKVNDLLVEVLKMLNQFIKSLEKTSR